MKLVFKAGHTGASLEPGFFGGVGELVARLVVLERRYQTKSCFFV